jgi:transposase
MKPEQLEIARLKREVTKLKAERDILKNTRRCFPPAGIETGCDMYYRRWRGAAVGFLVASTP